MTGVRVNLTVSTKFCQQLDLPWENWIHPSPHFISFRIVNSFTREANELSAEEHARSWLVYFRIAIDQVCSPNPRTFIQLDPPCFRQLCIGPQEKIFINFRSSQTGKIGVDHLVFWQATVADKSSATFCWHNIKVNQYLEIFAIFVHPHHQRVRGQGK